jgi:putative flavoprotein involved in K+ transport
MTSSEHVDCLVIGAGPAGLAAARELMRAGRRVLVLEQGDAIATSWRTHRPGLRLHTVRHLSGLPGLPIPREYGRYVTSANLVRYLENYAATLGIDVRFGVSVVRVDRADGRAAKPGWVVATRSGRQYLADTVIMATGYNRHPHVPELPGLRGFRRPHLHVVDYAGGDQFAGQDVLVVGAGNAAAEGATELVAAGARRVRMAVRTTPHIVRRRVGGVPMQSIAIVCGLIPVAVADRLAAGLARLTIPDLSARRLTRPRPDLYTRVRRDRSVPVHDTGIVRLLQTGWSPRSPPWWGSRRTPCGSPTVRLSNRMSSCSRPDTAGASTACSAASDCSMSAANRLTVPEPGRRVASTSRDSPCLPRARCGRWPAMRVGLRGRSAGETARSSPRSASDDQPRVISFARLGSPDFRKTDATWDSTVRTLT